MSLLAGKRILLVEDEFIIALAAQDMLGELGATVIGPVSSIAEGVARAETESIDAAVLDVNIFGERIDRVADALAARNIPIVFTTGYGRGAFGTTRASTTLDKPYTKEKLADALASVLRGRQ